jgi:tetratricopeptide (TPR) repeat protein
MKKVFAIVAAVALAFLLAMGDQLYKAVAPTGDFSWSSIKAVLGFKGDETIAIPTKPKLPSITTIEEPEETNLSYDERIKKGDYYREKGFLTFAANEYVKASDLEPKNPDPYLRLTQANFELGDFDKAEADANQTLALDSSNTEARYYLVLIATKQSKFDQALQLISQLEQDGITDSRITFYKGLIYITQGKHPEGKDLLSQVSADPTVTPALKDKADTMLAAYQEFEFAQGAEDLYLGELLSRGLNQISEFELAVTKLKDILKSRPDLRDAWNLLGFAYLNLNNTLFAVTAFEQSYKLDPQLATTQYFLGISYAEIGRKDDSIVYLNYALSNGFEPKVVAQRKLADLYLDKADYAKSVQGYEEILKENNQDINAFVRPIWIYLEFLNQPEKALKLGEAAVIAFPGNAMAYNLLGWSQIGTENYIEGEKNLLKSIQMDPTQAAPHYNLGKLYEATNDIEKAKAQYQSAYQLDQNGSIGNLAAKRYNILLVQ